MIKVTGKKNALLHNAATKEHLYQKSKGGSNDMDNLVAACRDCNSSRGDYSHHIWKNDNFRNRVLIYRKLRKTSKRQRKKLKVKIKRKFWLTVEKIDSIITYSLTHSGDNHASTVHSCSTHDCGLC
jgi:endonuclease I